MIWVCFRHEFLRDRHASTDTEGASSNLEAGCGLFALIFVEIYATDDPVDGGGIKSPGDNGRRPMVFLNVKPQNFIQNFVRRESILIGLIGAQFGAWRFFNRAMRNEFPSSI